MAQQFDYPKTETQLREIQDKLYQHSKEARDAGDRPAFKGLLPHGLAGHFLPARQRCHFTYFNRMKCRPWFLRSLCFSFSRDAGDRPAFKGLLEIMSAEVTIITAIHNIKSNHGSETPGVDSKTMRNDYLHNPFSWVVND